jgi:hypothetical protein
MGPRLDVARRAVALATAISFALSPAAPLVAAPAQAPAAPPAVGPPAPKPTAAQKAAAASPAPATPAVTPPDGGWPRAYATPSGGKIIVYQPQIASWEGQKQMTAYAAVSYEAKGAPKPALGSVKLEASTKVSVAERLVSFKDLRITESNFPTLPKEQTRDVVAEVDKSIPDQERVIALDRVLASVDRSQIIPKEVPGVKADPPVIFSSQTPAVLVNIDGEPIWSPIKENDLKYAVNTNWDLFLHDPTKTYYLRKEGVFLKAADLKGPWGPAGQLPGSFAKLPADDNWKEVKAVLPGKKIDAKQAPRVFVSTVPAEMILIEGKPAYQQVVGTSLYWVGNSDNDLFRVGQTGPVYFLVAGRWFSSPGFEGPWTFATPTLPADFQKIPLEHPRSRVLASVPGTAQAAEAVLLAQVPQTARVNKKQTKAPEVAYAGEPKFEKVEKTKVERAVNTDKSIIKVGDMYYMCYEGVWFMGSSPTGPWTVASKVPGEIYEIPISSPVHNVTYVTVEDDDDDEWATFATAAMYTESWWPGAARSGAAAGTTRRITAASTAAIPITVATTRPTVTALRTTPGRALTAAACRPTDPTGAPASARATTLAPALIHAAPLHTVPMARAPPARPTTRARAPTARRARVRTCTGAGARRRSSAATSGPPRRGRRTT